MKDYLSNLWKREPARFVALAVAIVDLAVVFGVPIDPEQKAAIVTVISAIGVEYIRSRVTPV
jgi:hypothetical protein